MITQHQPAIFDNDVIAAVSSVDDGNMRFGRGDDELARQNRRTFLEKVGINPERASLVYVTFDTEDFARYRIVTDDDKGEGIFGPGSNTPVDALVTTKPGRALFLILADCTGVVIYDSKQRILMLSHVGRHSAEIDGALKSVNYLAEHFGTNPVDVKVWLSPAVGKAAYPLRNKGGKGLHETILEQLAVAGVPRENIEASTVDTAQSKDYFSHSQFRAGNQDFDGRFAVVAQMREQGEPAF